MLHFRQLTNSECNALFKENPTLYIPIEQSPDWRKVEQYLEVSREFVGIFAYFFEKRIVATARIVNFKARLRNYSYINQGPIWFIEPTKIMEEELIKTIIFQLKKKPLYLRMQLHFNHKNAQSCLEPFMYNRAIWVNLSDNEDKIMNNFSSSTRRHIKKAIKSGVKIKRIPYQDSIKIMKNELLPILYETTKRSNFSPKSNDVYFAMIKGMNEYVKLYGGYIDDKIVCWLMSTEYHNHAQYPYAAGNDIARKTSASFLLQWEVMKEMKKRGNKFWDMTAIESLDYPQFKKVTQFKKGFSKNIVNLPNHYDVVVNSLKYRIIKKSLLLKRKFF